MSEGQAGRTLGRRLRARAVAAGAWLLCRLPERPLLAAADILGLAWYRLAPDRRRRARRNLARVARHLADTDRGTPATRAAAHDARALSALVRDAFRHAVRYYVQLLRAPVVDSDYLDRWLVIETPDVIEAGLAEPAGTLFVSLHLGWPELPALYVARRTGRTAVVPSEVLADPELQAFMVETRHRLGLELVGLSSARHRLVAALRGGGVVGLLGDRDITGGGIDVPLFGAPAPLPVGPALLSLETGAQPYVFGVWRADDGTYHARGERVPMPAKGTRRERVTAYLEAEARVFEDQIARAPEQWLAVFHPIWADLEAAALSEARGMTEARA
jgi:lauroyl/myristoyl acyltransferase